MKDSWIERAAHHEAGHATIASHYGRKLCGIWVGEPGSIGGPSIVTYVNPLPVTHSSTVHIFQAGVAADRIYDPDLGEDEDEFLWEYLLEEVRWKYAFVDSHEYGLTLKDYRRGMRKKGTCVTDYALETDDDYSLAFNSVIHHHWWHVRPGTMPTDKSILRSYREHERVTHGWLTKNWPRVQRLAAAILESPMVEESHFLAGGDAERILRNI